MQRADARVGHVCLVTAVGAHDEVGTVPPEPVPEGVAVVVDGSERPAGQVRGVERGCGQNEVVVLLVRVCVGRGRDVIF